MTGSIVLCCSSEVCVNSYGDDELCNEWADYNQCAKNPSFMLPNCEKACNQCKSIAYVILTDIHSRVCFSIQFLELSFNSPSADNS